jgi:glycerol-3-phosphate dehydrogenase (NAD(P)+)
MATPYFRTYTSEDMVGVEIGGALKNVIAVASGIVEGLGFGNNTRAALITRGLAEITRMGKCFGADERTFAGLSGMGDLVLTCTSSLSRNFSVGRELGKGRRLSAILDEMNMVAEGVYTTRAAQDLSKKHGVKMPIVNEVYKILFEDKHPTLAVKDLMSRELTNEIT